MQDFVSLFVEIFCAIRIRGKMQFLKRKKKRANFIKIGKVYLLNLDFSASWECFRSVGKIFQPTGEEFDTGNWTQFCIEN